MRGNPGARPKTEAAKSVKASAGFAKAESTPRFVRVLELLPERARTLLPATLAEAGDPDHALLQLEALAQQHPTELSAAVENSPLALRATVLLLGSSPWLTQSLLQNPDLLAFFARPAGLTMARQADDLREQFARFRLRQHQSPLPVLLARFKRREYIRIFLRELLGLATLAEITEEISVLADVMIGEALEHSESVLRRQFQGWPQLRLANGRVAPARFSVLALGKLGGNELNYSSDVDLLYLCDDLADAGTLAITSAEFFTRLAQELTRTLDSVSAEGPVYRVDLRLRPQGSSGEMVVGLDQAARYYTGQAHDWELQALLKLRHSAGDATLAREFIRFAQPLVYREALTLEAIQTAARSLERIRRGAARRATQGLDVKTGAGGLREIEFAVQCLQRVHGGGESWLRSSGTLPALQKLHDKGHIGDAEFRQLGRAYTELRGIEHRLQCRLGTASHRLPAAPAEQSALFRTMPKESSHTLRELKELMAEAAQLCASVLRLGADSSVATPLSARLGSPGAERLAAELCSRSPQIARTLASGIADPARRNLMRFIAAAATDEDRLRATLAEALLIERALPVFAQSALATDILARHPSDIAALFEEIAGAPGTALDAPIEAEAGANVADHLRRSARAAMLRNAGRTLLEGAPVWDVLAAHSAAFDSILQQAFASVDAPDGMAVYAVGRLGTCELDVVSDADLLFVRAAESPAEGCERAARALVALLSGYTREGSAISVDTRLRPHGGEGELVVSTRRLAQYFAAEAEAWEVIAFAKLRHICGEPSLGAEVEEALGLLRSRHVGESSSPAPEKSAPAFATQLRAIRKRLEGVAQPESFKNGPGGLYDLDFLLGLLEAFCGLSSAGLQAPVRLSRLGRNGSLSPQQELTLRGALELYRRADHAVRIVEGRSLRWLPENDLRHAAVLALLGEPELDEKLRWQMGAVRSIFDKFFDAASC